MAKAPEARYQDLESLRQDLAAVRTRLLEMSSETEAEDPEAETRFQSVAVASGAPPGSSPRVRYDAAGKCESQRRTPFNTGHAADASHSADHPRGRGRCPGHQPGRYLDVH